MKISEEFSGNKSQTQLDMEQDPLAKTLTWESMVNDIEVYQKIKKVVVDSFRSVLEYMPPQVRLVVEDKIVTLDETQAIFSFEELESFFTSAKIYSTSILSNLDNKNISDYAGPYNIILGLDRLVSMGEGYTEENVKELGVKLVGAMYGLKERILQTDWRKGWE